MVNPVCPRQASTKGASPCTRPIDQPTGRPLATAPPAHPYRTRCVSASCSRPAALPPDPLGRGRALRHRAAGDHHRRAAARKRHKGQQGELSHSSLVFFVSLWRLSPTFGKDTCSREPDHNVASQRLTKPPGGRRNNSALPTWANSSNSRSPQCRKARRSSATWPPRQAFAAARIIRLMDTIQKTTAQIIEVVEMQFAAGV